MKRRKQTIQKRYQNAQLDFRHFLIWSGSKKKKKKQTCAEFRGTESRDKIIQFYVDLLRSYLKIQSKPKQLKLMFQFTYSDIFSVYPFSCWTAFYTSQCINFLNIGISSVHSFLLIFSCFMYLHSIPAYMIVRISLLVWLFLTWGAGNTGRF